MKNNNKFMKRTILLISAIFFIAQGLSARIIIINVGQGGFFFVPASVTDAVVGDTVRFSWVAGIHTTTSTTIPAGAAAWDSPMTSTSQLFDYKITVPGTYNYKCTPHALLGMTGSFVASPNAILQTGTVVNDYALMQNYPNPFNPATNIKFSIPAKSNVKLSIYSVTGSLVAQPLNESLSEGEYKFEFNASGLASGVYFYRIEAGKFSQVRHMILLK